MMNDDEREQLPSRPRPKHRIVKTTTIHRRRPIQHDGVSSSPPSLSASTLFLTSLVGAVAAMLVMGIVLIHYDLVDEHHAVLGPYYRQYYRSISSSNGFLSSLLKRRKRSKKDSITALGPEWDVPISLVETGRNQEQLQKQSQPQSSELRVLQQELDRVEPFNRPQEEETSVINHHPNTIGQIGRTRIVNSFLQNTTLLQQLAQPFLWEECHEGPVRWIPIRSPNNPPTEQNTTRTIWEDLALQIWNQQQPEMKMNHDGNPVAGLEYWCNILTPESPLAWHVDKDEVLYSQTSETDSPQIRNPTMGAVYYGYPHVVQGGYLELLQYGVHNNNRDKNKNNDNDSFRHYESAGREVERFRPEYNRLIYLNVSHWHGVSPVWSGMRYTFAVNVWHGSPPLAFASSSKEE